MLSQWGQAENRVRDTISNQVVHQVVNGAFRSAWPYSIGGKLMNAGDRTGGGAEDVS